MLTPGWHTLLAVYFLCNIWYQQADVHYLQFISQLTFDNTMLKYLTSSALLTLAFDKTSWCMLPSVCFLHNTRLMYITITVHLILQFDVKKQQCTSSQHESYSKVALNLTIMVTVVVFLVCFIVLFSYF